MTYKFVPSIIFQIIISSLLWEEQAAVSMGAIDLLVFQSAAAAHLSSSSPCYCAKDEREPYA